MADYLLVESRDPFEFKRTGDLLELAEGLVRKGHNVRVFLVENGVLPARRSAASSGLTRLSSLGVRILADDFSLRERGITKDRMIEQIEVAPIEVLLDGLAAGAKAVWH